MTAWPPLLVLTMSTFFFSALTVNEGERDEAVLLGEFEMRGREDGEMERDDEREWWEFEERRERRVRGEREEEEEEEEGEEKKRREEEDEATTVSAVAIAGFLVMIGGVKTRIRFCLCTLKKWLLSLVSYT